MYVAWNSRNDISFVRERTRGWWRKEETRLSRIKTGRSLIFTLGILDPESPFDSDDGFNFFPPFPSFSPPILTFSLDLFFPSPPRPTPAPSAPSATPSRRSLPPRGSCPPSGEAVAILRSSSILRPRTPRFFPPFFPASTDQQLPERAAAPRSPPSCDDPSARHQLLPGVARAPTDFRLIEER